VAALDQREADDPAAGRGCARARGPSLGIASPEVIYQPPRSQRAYGARSTPARPL